METKKTKEAKVVRYAAMLFAPNYGAGSRGAVFRLAFRRNNWEDYDEIGVTSNIISITRTSDGEAVIIETKNSKYKIEGRRYSRMAVFDEVKSYMESEMTTQEFFDRKVPNRMPTQHGWILDNTVHLEKNDLITIVKNIEVVHHGKESSQQDPYYNCSIYFEKNGIMIWSVMLRGKCKGFTLLDGKGSITYNLEDRQEEEELSQFYKEMVDYYQHGMTEVRTLLPNHITQALKRYKK